MDFLELGVAFEDISSDFLDLWSEGDNAIFGDLRQRISDEDTILDLDLGARSGSSVDGLEAVLDSERSEVSDLVRRDDEVLLC